MHSYEKGGGPDGPNVEHRFGEISRRPGLGAQKLQKDGSVA
jgi:hypothetical protein